jgi:hypothetical protein
LFVPRLVTRGCSLAAEVIDLVDVSAEIIDLTDDNSSTGATVKDLMDDDASLETVHPHTIDGEDLSLGSMSEASGDALKSIDDWETLSDTFGSETSTSVDTQPTFPRHDLDTVFRHDDLTRVSQMQEQLPTIQKEVRRVVPTLREDEWVSLRT